MCVTRNNEQRTGTVNPKHGLHQSNKPTPEMRLIPTVRGYTTRPILSVTNAELILSLFVS